MNRITDKYNAVNGSTSDVQVKEFKERLSFLDLDAEGLRTLQAIWPVVEPHIDGILNAFYERCSLFPKWRRSSVPNLVSMG